ILDHLGHGVTSEPVPLEGGAIGEYRELSGCFIQAGKLEPGIGCRSFLTLRRECVGVATLEICPNGCATDRIIDDDETPGLAQSTRGRWTREMNQARQVARRQWIAAKASNIPPPDEQIAQPRAKAIIEGHCLAAVRNRALRPHAGFLASAPP